MFMVGLDDCKRFYTAQFFLCFGKGSLSLELCSKVCRLAEKGEYVYTTCKDNKILGFLHYKEKSDFVVGYNEIII